MAADLELATEVARELWPDRVGRVTAIKCEWSPGRGDARYLDNRSAFDVCLEHTTPAGDRAFTAVEVKYHENLRGGAARWKPRYAEVARHERFGVEVFGSPYPERLTRPPLQQIWLDHLLALSMLQAGAAVEGRFVFLHPADNRPCVRAAAEYESVLVDGSTFEAMTLERMVGARLVRSVAECANP